MNVHWTNNVENLKGKVPSLLAIEVDGASYDEKIERDDVRQQKLEFLGVRFLRFTDREVKTNLHGVVMTIEDWIDAYVPTLNPSGGGE